MRQGSAPIKEVLGGGGNKRKTTVINIVAGPGAGKTTTCAFLIGMMKIMPNNRAFQVEFVAEVAKQMVYAKDWDGLRDQFNLSKQQYERLKHVEGCVDYIVTDGSLLHGLYYNRYNPHNVCKIQITERQILDWYGEFDNRVVFLVRGDFEYKQAGRCETKAEALEIDVRLKDLLQQHNIAFREFPASIDSVPNILEYVMGSSAFKK